MNNRASPPANEAHGRPTNAIDGKSTTPGADRRGKVPKYVPKSLVQHSRYRDRSRELPQGTEYKTARGGITNIFPLRMHRCLSGLEADGLSGLCSWQPHGRAFVIHRPKDFEAVMGQYFGKMKLSSMQRQLNLYGFQRISAGPDKGAHYHEYFLRDREYLCFRVARIQLKGTGPRGAANPDQEPNFYAMEPIKPLADWRPPAMPSSPSHRRDAGPSPPPPREQGTRLSSQEGKVKRQAGVRPRQQFSTAHDSHRSVSVDNIGNFGACSKLVLQRPPLNPNAIAAAEVLSQGPPQKLPLNPNVIAAAEVLSQGAPQVASPWKSKTAAAPPSSSLGHPHTMNAHPSYTAATAAMPSLLTQKVLGSQQSAAPLLAQEPSNNDFHSTIERSGLAPHEPSNETLRPRMEPNRPVPAAENAPPRCPPALLPFTGSDAFPSHASFLSPMCARSRTRSLKLDHPLGCPPEAGAVARPSASGMQAENQLGLEKVFADLLSRPLERPRAPLLDNASVTSSEQLRSEPRQAPALPVQDSGGARFAMNLDDNLDERRERRDKEATIPPSGGLSNTTGCKGDDKEEEDEEAAFWDAMEQLMMSTSADNSNRDGSHQPAKAAFAAPNEDAAAQLEPEPYMHRSFTEASRSFSVPGGALPSFRRSGSSRPELLTMLVRGSSDGLFIQRQSSGLSCCFGSSPNLSTMVGSDEVDRRSSWLRRHGSAPAGSLNFGAFSPPKTDANGTFRKVFDTVPSHDKEDEEGHERFPFVMGNRQNSMNAAA